MHALVPAFIQDRTLAGETRGDFLAVGLFLDVSGFSRMTDTLMSHGQHGAEVLAQVMRSVFDPLFNHIFAQGGFVASSAGDSLTALFVIEGDLKQTALRAAAAGWNIQQHMAANPTYPTVYQDFPITVKVGLAEGPVQWGIISASTSRRAVYFFQGEAVDGSALAEQQAQAGQIILLPGLVAKLADWVDTLPAPGGTARLAAIHRDLPQPVPLPKPVMIRQALTQFFPEAVIDLEISGEFRQVVNLLISLPSVRTETQLRIFMESVFSLQEIYGGLINKLDFGDKGTNLVMYWGAPAAYENDVDRALNFILNLQESTSIPISAGVTYRVAHAGFIGGQLFEDFTCFGRGVNLAARFMTSSPRGEIWVDEHVAREAGKGYAIEYLEERTFKGFRLPQKVYVLLERKEAEADFYQGRLVGRDADRAALSAFLQPMFAGKFAGMVIVSGEPGMGKSRLVHSFLKEAGEQAPGAFQVFFSQTDEIVRKPFNPFVYWLRRYFGIEETQGEARSKRSFNRRLDELIEATPDRRLADELDRTRSFLGALIGLRWADSLYEQLDAQGRYTNTFIGLTSLVQAESLRLPVVLVLEDIHLLDSDSIAFLPYLMRAFSDPSGPAYPVGLVATSRLGPEELGEFAQNCQSLRLEGLDRDNLRVLIQNQLGDPPAPALLDLLEERAEGNPFYAEQILLYLKAENQLVREAAGWDSRRQVETLPANISSLLVSRLDHLAREVRETVQTAAVLGREFDIHLLGCMLQNCDPPAEMDEVRAAEIEGIWAQLNEIHYIFKHILMREAAYQMQVHARRQRLHALALEAYETFYQDELAPHYADLAYHAEQAGLVEPARRYLRLAGEAARDAYHNRQAADFLTRALDLTPPGEVETRCDLLVALEGLYSAMGQYAERKAALTSLAEISQTVDNADRRVEILLRQCLCSADHGLFDEAEGYAKQAMALIHTETVLDKESEAYGALAFIDLRRSRLAQAQEYALLALQSAQASGSLRNEMRAENIRGLIALDLGRTGDSRRSFTRSLEIARQLGLLRYQTAPLSNLANVARMEGNLAESLDYHHQSIQITHQIGYRAHEGMAMGNIGFVYNNLGEFQQARQYLESSLQINRLSGNMTHVLYGLINLSACEGAIGDYERAKKAALEGLEMARQMQERSGEAWALTYLGHSLLSTGSVPEAAEAYSQALAIREEMNQPDLATEPAAGLARTALAQGNLQAASAALEPVLAYLDAGGELGATDEPLRVYLVCWQVLHQTGDPRAPGILTTAHRLLQERASSIPNAATRQAFLTNIAHNREIQEAWGKFK